MRSIQNFDEVKKYGKFSKEVKELVTEILSIRKTLILSPNSLLAQSLILALLIEARKNSWDSYLLRLDHPGIFDPLQVVEFDEKSKNYKIIPGSLFNCITKNGLLIVEDILSAPGAKQLKALFKKGYFRHNDSKPIEVDDLRIIGVQIANSSQFKLPNNSLLTEFKQIRWLDAKTNLLSPPTLETVAISDEKSLESTVVVDCGFKGVKSLEALLIGTYIRRENGELEYRLGELPKAFEQKKSCVVLDNLQLTNIPIINLITDLLTQQELKLSVQKKINISTLKLTLGSSVTFEQLKIMTKNKFLHRITGFEFKALIKKNTLIYLLNENSIREFNEFCFSKQDDSGQYYWQLGPGFLDRLKAQQKEFLVIINGPLDLEQLYPLLKDPSIPRVFVFDNVALPSLLSPLFKKGLPSFDDQDSELKSEVKTSSPPIQVYVCEPHEYQQQVSRLVSHSGPDTRVIFSTPSYDNSLFVTYDAQRRPEKGVILEDLEKGKQLIIVDIEGLFLDQFPNLFLPHPFLQYNGTPIDPATKINKRKITLVVNPETYNNHPFLSGLPSLEMPKINKMSWQRSNILKSPDSGSCDEFELSPEALAALSGIGFNGLVKTLEKSEGAELIEILGPKATGKTYSFYELEEKKRAVVHRFIASASTTSADLCKVIEKWKADSEVKDDKRWHVLLIDEFTLANPAELYLLISLLYVLRYQCSSVLPNGKEVSFPSKNHHLCVAGNPADMTANRTPHELLGKFASQVTFLPLSPYELSEKIIVPGLITECKLEEKSAQEVAALLIHLQEQISLLDPKITLNPRDIWAIIAHMAAANWAEFKFLPPQLEPIEPMTALFQAIETVVLPQLSSIKRRVLRAWLQQRLNPQLTSYITLQQIKILLSQCSAIWQHPQLLKFTASLLGFIKVHEFYAHQNKLIPGKGGLLIVGELDIKEIVNWVLERMGFTSDQRIEMTVGPDVDLALAIEQGKKAHWPLILYDIDEAPPGILESLLNPLLTGEEKDFTSLIVCTARSLKAGGNSSQIISDPALSRFTIIYTKNVPATDIFPFHNIPQEEFEFLLRIHHSAGKSVDLQMLINAIRHREAGMPLEKAAGIIYAVPLQQAPVPFSTESALFDYSVEMLSNYFILLDEKRIVAVKKPQDLPLGALDFALGRIYLSTLPSEVKEKERLLAYSILLLRTLQFQILQAYKEVTNTLIDDFSEEIGLLQAYALLRKYYPGAYALLKPKYENNHQNLMKVMTSSSTQGLNGEPKKFIAMLYSEVHLKSDPRNLNARLILLCLRWYQMSVLVRSEPPDWKQIHQLCNTEQFRTLFSFAEKLGELAIWFAGDPKDLEAVLFLGSPVAEPTAAELKSAVKKNSSTIVTTIQVLMKILKQEYPIPIDQEEKVVNKYQRRGSLSGALTRDKEITLLVAKVDSSVVNGFLPVKHHLIDSSGWPKLSADGYFPTHYLPNSLFAPLSSPLTKPCGKINLVSPQYNSEGGVVLLTPYGCRPQFKQSRIKVSWQDGRFIAYIPEELKAEKIEYQIIPADTKDETAGLRSSPKQLILKNPIEMEKIPYQLRIILTLLQEAALNKDFNQISLLLRALQRTFAQIWQPLDKDKHQKARQALNTLYEQKDARAIVLNSLQKLTGVCIEAALTFYTLCRQFLPNDIEVFLTSGYKIENNEVWFVGHSVVGILWPGMTYPQIYDPTDPEVKDFRSSPHSKDSKISVSEKKPTRTLPYNLYVYRRRISPTFFLLQNEDSEEYPSPKVKDLILGLTHNPLLLAYSSEISQALEPIYKSLSRLSLSTNTQKALPHPPGRYDILGEILGHKDNFFVSVPDKKWTSSILLVTGLPSILESTKLNLFNQFSCLEHLIKLLLEKKFDIWVWIQKSGPKKIKDSKKFIKSIPSIYSPSPLELNEFNPNFSFTILDKNTWKEILINYAQILQTVIPNEAKLKFSKSKAGESKLHPSSDNKSELALSTDYIHNTPEIALYNKQELIDYLTEKLGSIFELRDCKDEPNEMSCTLVIKDTVLDHKLISRLNNVLKSLRIMNISSPEPFSSPSPCSPSSPHSPSSGPRSAVLIPPKYKVNFSLTFEKVEITGVFNSSHGSSLIRLHFDDPIKIYDSYFKEKETYESLLQSNNIIELIKCQGLDFLSIESGQFVEITDVNNVRKISLRNTAGIQNTVVDQKMLDDFCYVFHLYFDNCQFSQEIDFSKFIYLQQIHLWDCSGCFPKIDSVPHILTKLSVLHFNHKDKSKDKFAEFLANSHITRDLEISANHLPNILKIEAKSSLENLRLKLPEEDRDSISESTQIILERETTAISSSILTYFTLNLFASNYFLWKNGQIDLPHCSNLLKKHLDNCEGIWCLNIIMDIPTAIYNSVKDEIVKICSGRPTITREINFIDPPVETAIDYFIAQVNILQQESKQDKESKYQFSS